MSKHRRPDSKVPKPSSPNNFSPASALESLYVDLIEVDAFAHAAGEAIAELTPPANRAGRRHVARCYTLVTRAAEEARAALLRGDALMKQLSTYLAARRSQADGPADRPS